jgi:aspartate racemase
MSPPDRVRLTVGVLGGMGPDATADFFTKLVRASRAERDQDHLRVVIDNDPRVPDRTAGIEGRGTSPAPHLEAMTRGLVAMGAELLVMPCNAAHAFEAQVRAASAPVPFISLIETTAEALLARAPGVDAAGLLATDGTLRAGLYQEELERRGVRALLPTADDQRRVMAAIYAVKRGRADDAARAELIAVAERLSAAGAGAVIAACTEVPLLLADGDVVVDGRALPVISSTDALVARTVAVATAAQRLP